MSDEKLKFCVDCKWHCEGHIPSILLCHAKSMGFNLVTGVENFLLCSTQRQLDETGYCGRKAEWFEPKE